MKKNFILPLLAFICLASVARSAILMDTSIIKQNVNLRGSTALVLGQVTLNAPGAGTVLVHFDGQCYSDSGDQIILAASNTTTWGSNDGNVAVMAANKADPYNSFSHSRMYAITAAGTNTFYAVGQNFSQTGGSGVASVYGKLVAEFYPASAGGPTAAFQGILQTRLNLRGSAVNVGQVTLTAPSAGTVIVRFDGNVSSAFGDRIVVAASNASATLGANDGEVGVQTLSSLAATRSFSHSRMYAVAAGSSTFYAVARNLVDTGGTGIASIYGGLSVVYFPTGSTVASQVYKGFSQTGMNIRGGVVTIAKDTLTAPSAGKVLLHFDGQCVSSLGDQDVLAASNTAGWTPNDGNVSVQAISNTLNISPFSHSMVYPVSAGANIFNAVAQNYVNTAGTGIAGIYGGLTVEFIANGTTGILSASESDNKEITVSYKSGDRMVNLLFPPSNRIFTGVRLFSSAGRMMRSMKAYGIESGSVKIGASDLPKGVYFVELRGAARNEVVSFTKY